MSQYWLYVLVASLHLPGIGLLVYLLRDLAASDPPAHPVARPPSGDPPDGWRWRRPRTPQRGSGAGSSRARGTIRGSSSRSSMTA